MDSVRNLIVARVAELGLSLAELSLRAGKNHAYFQQFIKRGIPDRLPEEVRALVAQILRVDESQLKSTGKKALAPVIPPNAEVSGEVQIATRIPVYGQAVGGRDGEFILNGNRVADILAPPSLSRVADAYARLCGRGLHGAALFRRRDGVREFAAADQQRRIRGRPDRHG